jgi:DNA-binding transcriptional ArsR family regulator
VDDVFKALADRSRRRLLDKLFKRDGQTLGELALHLPDMTRFGVMKHLHVLEDARLVTTRKIGREKLHYLNPVPIRRIFDRWTSKYARPFTHALADLKKHLEGDDEMDKPGPKHVYEIYIRTTPEKLWQAVTDPAFTKQYFFEQSVQSTWQKGASYEHRTADGTLRIVGKILEIDPPCRVTWLIEKVGEACKLTLTHDDFDGETATFKSVGKGWNPVLSGLKTLIETGKPLVLGAA